MEEIWRLTNISISREHYNNVNKVEQLPVLVHKTDQDEIQDYINQLTMNGATREEIDLKLLGDM